MLDDVKIKILNKNLKNLQKFGSESKLPYEQSCI